VCLQHLLSFLTHIPVSQYSWTLSISMIQFFLPSLSQSLILEYCLQSLLVDTSGGSFCKSTVNDTSMWSPKMGLNPSSHEKQNKTKKHCSIIYVDLIWRWFLRMFSINQDQVWKPTSWRRQYSWRTLFMSCKKISMCSRN
jgi:hypothetical protein